MVWYDNSVRLRGAFYLPMRLSGVERRALADNDGGSTVYRIAAP